MRERVEVISGADEVEVVSKGGGIGIVSKPQAVEFGFRLETVEAVSDPQTIEVVTGIVGGTPYMGSYEITPTTEDQVLSTSGRTLARDIRVGAIPDNYGLISWNGAVLTVS